MTVNFNVPTPPANQQTKTQQVAIAIAGNPLPQPGNLSFTFNPQPLGAGLTFHQDNSPPIFRVTVTRAFTQSINTDYVIDVTSTVTTVNGTARTTCRVTIKPYIILQQQAQQTQQQAQTQGGSQQNQNQFPGPQQQNAGIGTQISGRPSHIIRKTIHRRSGRAGKGINLILHAQRRNYMNYANGNSMNRRQTLRNYRSR